MNTLTLTGRILVEDILGVIDLDQVPEGCKLSVDDRVSMDDVEVGAELAIDALDDAELLPQPEGFSDQLDQTDVMNLAEAVRIGDRIEAELMLDRIFASDKTVEEWVQRGRYSMKARKAKAAANEPLRKVA